MTRRLLWLILAFTIAATPVLSSGCASFKPDPTQTEQQQTRELAGKILKSLQSAVVAMRALQDLEISFHQGGLVTDTDHKKIQQAFLIAFGAMDVAVVQIGAATTQPQLRTTLGLVKTTVSDLAAVLAVPAPNASKALQTAAATIGLAVDVALALLGGV